jgi:hypothetical protein
VREERRAEITSDVWEHLQAGGSSMAVLSRCLRGAAADLGWRRAHRTGRALPSGRAFARMLGWFAAALSFAFFLAQHAWFSSALIGLDLYGDDWEAGDVERTASISGALLALLVAGAVLLRSRPRLGAAAVSLAALTTTGIMWWASPILGPMAAAITGAAVAIARRRLSRAAAA